MRKTDALLESVEEIAVVLRDFGSRADAERKLPDAAYDAMLDAGLFGMVAPKEMGGMELHPTDLFAVIEAVARIDSAAAWNLNQASSVAGAVPWLSAAGVVAQHLALERIVAHGLRRCKLGIDGFVRLVFHASPRQLDVKFRCGGKSQRSFG